MGVYENVGGGGGGYLIGVLIIRDFSLGVYIRGPLFSETPYGCVFDLHEVRGRHGGV